MHWWKEAAPRPNGSKEDAQKKKKPTDMERVCFHGNSTDFYKGLLHDFHAGVVLDATPLNENCAMAAIMKKIPYVAVCYTEATSLNSI